MPITIKNDKDHDFVEIVAEGSITDDDMFACQQSLYEKEPMCYQLWDMSAADLSGITAKNLRRFVDIASEKGKARQGCRTAVVVQSSLQYGLGRMAQAFAEIEKLPYFMKLFKNRAEALAWLELAREGNNKA